MFNNMSWVGVPNLGVALNIKSEIQKGSSLIASPSPVKLSPVKLMAI